MNTDTPYIKFEDLQLKGTVYLVSEHCINLSKIDKCKIKSLKDDRDYLSIETDIIDFSAKPGSSRLVIDSEHRDICKKLSLHTHQTYYDGKLITADPRCAISFVKANLKRLIAKETKKVQEITESIKKLSEMNASINIYSEI